MSYGLSTRTIGSPVGTAGQYARQAVNVVPLSVFFLNMQGKGVDPEDNGLYGRRKREKKGKKKPAVDAAKAPGEQTLGGNAGQADRANKQSIDMARQTAAESAPGAVLTPVKFGATRASSGSMGTGNIARYHVPLGPPLRRVTPAGTPGGAKRKKRSKEERGGWVERMMKM